jgi:IS4 transposase
MKDESVLKWLKQQEKTIKLRITKIILCTGEIEILLSNLDMNIVLYDDLGELYNSRWGIETNYDFLKNIIELEAFSGKTKVSIEQDFYAKILCSNIEYAGSSLYRVGRLTY